MSDIEKSKINYCAFELHTLATEMIRVDEGRSSYEGSNLRVFDANQIAYRMLRIARELGLHKPIKEEG